MVDTHQRPDALPCGHDSDAINLRATTARIAYCCRCERGFELVQDVRVLDARVADEMLLPLIY